MPEVNINIDYKTVFLPCYHHLLNDGDKFKSKFFDIEFLYGGRDSGKSRHVAMDAVIECMMAPYFKCLIIRKVLNTVRGSQFDLIKSVIDLWGLSKLFKINETRMEIIFIPNGNGFYGRGLDDVGRIKSFNNPSHCWIEEGNQIESNDFIVVLTSLRAEQRVKTWFTFNPECEVNYTDFWLYQDWFSHTTDLSWEWTKLIQVDENVYRKFQSRCTIQDGVYYLKQEVRATQTTYKDNPYCAAERIALYESFKNSKNNAYWYQTYTLGLWGYKKTGGSFLECFDEEKNTKELPLQKNTIHVVSDNNVVPYIAISLWQIDINKKELNQIHELACEPPNATAAKAARQVVKYLERIGYNDTVFIYGDPSANARSTADDEGRSYFDKFKGEFRQAGYNITDRVRTSAPGVSISGDFVNEIFESNYAGWSININVTCRKSIEDYTMTKKAMDGTILKKRITDAETKQSFEKYGHFTDDLRYFATTVLNAEFINYSTRKKRRLITPA